MADPTPAHIEAAARAALAARVPAARWESCPPFTQDEWREVARAALTAAAQVQPARTVTAEQVWEAARTAAGGWVEVKRLSNMAPAFLAALGITVVDR